MSDQRHNLHDEHGHGHDHHLEDGQARPTHALYYEDSPDSSNGFVKIEKPHDFNSGGYPVFGSEQKVEITPSDDVAPPTGDDFKMDYAPSPQAFASELASNAQESLEQFLAATQRTASDVSNKSSRYASDLVGQFSPVEEEPGTEGQPAMYEEEEEEEEEHEHSPDRLQKAKEEVVKRIEDVQAKAERSEEPEESMYQRHGPLTLGKPATISSLSPQHHGGLTDIAHDIAEKVSDAAYMAGAKISDAAHVVGSKIHDAAVIGEEKILKADFKDNALDINEDSVDKFGAKVEEKSHQFTEKVIEGAKDISEKAKEIGGKAVDFGGKVIETTKDIGVKVVETTKDVGSTIVDSAVLAKDAVSEFATNVSTPVSNTATGDLLGDFGSPQKDTFPSSVRIHQTTSMTPSSSTKPSEKVSSCCFMNFKSMDPRMSDLLHWREPRKTGIVFAVTLAFLICLAVFPVISVAAYTGLIIILGTLSFRLYKMIMAFVQKTEQQNPFKPYLDTNLQAPQDRIHSQVDNVVKHVENLLIQLRRLFLVENVVDTLKFAVLLWALTYVGACLSVMALIIIAFVGLFTLPKFYETYKTQIDHYYNIVHSKAKQACDTVQEKVPQLKKKVHPE